MHKVALDSSWVFHHFSHDSCTGVDMSHHGTPYTLKSHQPITAADTCRFRTPEETMLHTQKCPSSLHQAEARKGMHFTSVSIAPASFHSVISEVTPGSPPDSAGKSTKMETSRMPRARPVRLLPGGETVSCVQEKISAAVMLSCKHVPCR